MFQSAQDGLHEGTASKAASEAVLLQADMAFLVEKMPDGVILLEPNSYYRDSLHMTLRMPEPSVLYYYTGLKAVWMNDPPVVVSKARYLLRVSKRGVNLDEIKSQQQLQQIIDTYKKYPPVL